MSSLYSHAIRYFTTVLATGEHTDPMTGERIVLNEEQQKRVQECVDLLVAEGLLDAGDGRPEPS